MVVPSVRAIFQIMASTGSLRASSPFGGVARSHARAERERRRAFSRGSLGLLAIASLNFKSVKRISPYG